VFEVVSSLHTQTHAQVISGIHTLAKGLCVRAAVDETSPEHLKTQLFDQSKALDD
jgi:hypothetical protein